MREQSISEKILEVVIKVHVSKKLYDLEEELSKSIMEIEKVDYKEAKLKILEIIMKACSEFYCTMYDKIKNSRP
jgi:hypothetical protein